MADALPQQAALSGGGDHRRFLCACDQRGLAAFDQFRAAHVDTPLLAPASGPSERVIAYVKTQLPPDSEYKSNVEVIFGYYWQYAPSVGIEPFLAGAQCVFEVNALRCH